VSLPRPLERDVQAAILDLLALRRAEAIRTNSGAVKVGTRYVQFNKTPGCSDVLACYRGQFLALEVKRDHREEPTDDQAAFLARVRDAGGVGEVVWSIEQVGAILDSIDRECDR
jgi:hypothetical protein